MGGVEDVYGLSKHSNVVAMHHCWFKGLEAKRARVARVMALVTRVACDKEGNGDSSESNGNKGGRQAMATRAMATAKVITWAIMMATRQAGDEEGYGKGSKGNGNGNEAGGQRRGYGQQLHGNSNKGGRHAMAMATKRAIAMAMRVAGDKEGNGDCVKSNGDGVKGGGQVASTRAMATMVAGKQQQ